MSVTIKNRSLITATIILLLLSTIQIVIGDNVSNKEAEIINAENNDSFNDCIILIFGKCNDVTGPILWKFGLYCNFFKKDFTINANGEIDETINLIIRGGGGFKFMWGKENIKINLNGATGILFWGGKSLLVENNFIIARCQADNAYLIY
ncbi:MAG: hypothetical protein AYK22_04130 [Thermoplasmatales archaeon SG8-52-3]|nr:MAG: hypothetical protein AYK22_04130 [Thermoplasmatales archaeon SG8-52-3]